MLTRQLFLFHLLGEKPLEEAGHIRLMLSGGNNRYALDGVFVRLEQAFKNLNQVLYLCRCAGQ